MLKYQQYATALRKKNLIKNLKIRSNFTILIQQDPPLLMIKVKYQGLL